MFDRRTGMPFAVREATAVRRGEVGSLPAAPPDLLKTGVAAAAEAAAVELPTANGGEYTPKAGTAEMIGAERGSMPLPRLPRRRPVPTATGFFMADRRFPVDA